MPLSRLHIRKRPTLKSAFDNHRSFKKYHGRQVFAAHDRKTENSDVFIAFLILGCSMQLKYKGFVRNATDSPKFALPANAVQFKEPETLDGLFRRAIFLYSIPLAALIFIIRGLKMLLWGTYVPWEPYDLLGCLITLLLVVPHELLHAVCFPKEAEVHLYFCSRGAMVTCKNPLTKRGFIFMSMLPLIVLGILPMLVWLAISPARCSSEFLFTLYTAAAIHTLGCCGDVMNVCNALRQVPSGAKVQMSGVHTYWFISDKKNV